MPSDNNIYMVFWPGEMKINNDKMFEINLFPTFEI